MGKYYTFFNKTNNKIIGVLKDKEMAEEIIRQRKEMVDFGVIIENSKNMSDTVKDDFKELAKSQLLTDFEGLTLFQTEEDVEYLYFPEALSDMYNVFEEATTVLSFLKFSEKEDIFINFLIIKLQEFMAELESDEFEYIDRCFGPSLDSTALTYQLIKDHLNPEEARKRNMRETLD